MQTHHTQKISESARTGGFLGTCKVQSTVLGMLRMTAQARLPLNVEPY